MRILTINQFFWPDVAATGQLLSDVARHLSAEGHDVTVICSGGSYTQAGRDTGDPPPVRILRVPGPPFQRGAKGRLVSYLMFFGGVVLYSFRVPRPEVVVTMTTPPLLAIAGTILKMIRGSRHYIWEMDVFPDALVSLGALSERGLLARFLGWIQDWSRRRSDGVIVLGPCMQARLRARGTPAHLLHVAENWADGRAISPRPMRRSGPLHVFYSGNLGLAHEIDTIAGAMRHFRSDPRFLFTFAGGGVGRGRLERFCASAAIKNARFTPYASLREMDEHLAQADIGLVTELPACIGTVVPSKVYGLMAAGRPLLFIGPNQATPGLLIQQFQCGWQIDPGDLPALIELMEWLWVNREVAWTHGQNARAAFDRHYDVSHGVSRVAAALRLEPQDRTAVA